MKGAGGADGLKGLGLEDLRAVTKERMEGGVAGGGGVLRIYGWRRCGPGFLGLGRRRAVRGAHDSIDPWYLQEAAFVRERVDFFLLRFDRGFQFVDARLKVFVLRLERSIFDLDLLHRVRAGGRGGPCGNGRRKETARCHKGTYSDSRLQSIAPTFFHS